MKRGEKYTINLEPSDGNLRDVERIVQQRLSQEPQEIRDLIDVRYDPFPVKPYGVNPQADSDSRSFVDLINPNGESMLPPPDISLRRSLSETKGFIEWCLIKIKEDHSRQIT